MNMTPLVKAKQLSVHVLATYLTIFGLGSALTTSSVGFAQQSRSAKRAAPKAYDLVKDAKGNVRPVYQDVFPIYEQTDLRDFDRQSRKDFKNFYSLDPLPVLLPRDQFERKQQGEIQRKNVLRMFLQDYYSGKKSYLQSGIISEEVVQRIIRRNGESGMEKYVKVDKIAFPYGADVTFDPQGNPIVIEDNIGHVGGPGDMHQSIVSYLKNQPLYRNVLNLPDPMEYYRDLIASYRAHATPADAPIVVYQVPPYDDAEEVLLAKVFPKNGVRVVTPFTREKLVITKRGAFLRSPDGKMERVGYVVLNKEASESDNQFPPFRDAFMESEIQTHYDDTSHLQTKEFRKKLKAMMDVRDPVTGRMDTKAIYRLLNRESAYTVADPDSDKSTVPGLIQAALDGKVGLNYTPGCEFVGDKEFYTYIEDLIRFYLHAEPIIKNIRTRRFGILNEKGEVVLDQKLFDEVVPRYRENVFKVVDGRGGYGIWLGPKMTAADIKKVKSLVEKDPGRYIVQDHVDLGLKDGYLIDSRTVQQVYADGRDFVPKFSWGRSVPLDGDGKVNVSQHGRVAPMFPVDDEPCTQVYRNSGNAALSH